MANVVNLHSSFTLPFLLGTYVCHFYRFYYFINLYRNVLLKKIQIAEMILNVEL